MSPLPPDVLGSYQDALAAEQRASFGYGLLGPALHAADQGLAHDCGDAHRAAQQAAAAAIAAAGASPRDPAPDYPSLYAGLHSPRELAARLEDGCAAAWRYLYERAAGSATAHQVRGPAQLALTASAVRATRWRVLAGTARPVVAFPGITET